MREIKFRAWDKFERKMWPVTLINFREGVAALEGYEGELVNEDTPLEGRRQNKPLKLLVLMQFTGLHDKSGKGIYEGDILKRNDIYEYEVKWNKCGWTIDSESECEVIGNIYENPELITI